MANDCSSKPLKVLQIIPQLSMGGAEIFTIRLSNELSAMGVQVTLVVFFGKERNAERCIKLDDRVSLVGLNKRHGIDFGLSAQLIRLLREERPDVISTHLRALYYVFPALLIQRIPCFHTIHTLAKKEEPNALVRKLKGILFKRKAVIPISISKAVDKSVFALYGTSEGVLIVNGATAPPMTAAFGEVKNIVQGLKSTPSTLVFVSVGTIKEAKNQILLIKAFQKLYREGANVALLLIGDEPGGGSQLREQLECAKAPNTMVLGARNNIGDYLRLADAFCLSSIYEGLPIALLEALSLGVVPLSTPVGGVVDVIRGSGVGYLTKDLSTAAYVETVKRFCSLDQNERRAMSERCRDVHQEKYSMERVAKQYLGAYKKAVAVHLPA